MLRLLATRPPRPASSLLQLPARALATTPSTGLKVLYPREDAENPPAPPPPLQQPLPFRVHRSRMGNLPVYSDTRSGGSKVVTVLRKYQGDVNALSTSISQLCKSDVQQFHGRIEVKGQHRETLKEWLAGLGF